VEKVKLSDLPDDAQMSIKESHTSYTVAELKHEILELGEPHHESTNWYTIKDETWTPDVESMIDRLIDDSYDEMYEDWDERARDCVDKETVEKIQVLLNEMFASARGYWEYDKAVEIDIFPQEKELKKII
jgi:hypothetical protein